MTTIAPEEWPVVRDKQHLDPQWKEEPVKRRRLDIGVASYRNPDKLRKTLETIEAMSHTDWRCFIVHNESDDDEGRYAFLVADRAQRMNSRFTWVSQPNSGYAGAVNRIFELIETPYVAYLDNDVEILTPGWDEKLCDILDRAPEVAQVFPGEGHYGFRSNGYHECLWSAGYTWVLRRDAADKISDGGALMDQSLGHHEEVDQAIRLRLAGYLIACDPNVHIIHHETSTQSPESAKRIHAGVVRFMNKWEKYFVGNSVKHPNPDPDSGEGYDPRFIRYTDWNVNSLYLERWILSQFPDLNANPETIQTSAGPMDVIKILKPAGCYKGRAI